MKQFFSVCLILMIAVTGYATPGIDDWDKSEPPSGAWINDGQVDIVANNAALDRMLANYRQGARLVYASDSTITVEAGEVMLSNSGGTIRVMAQNTSDTTVAWTDIDTGGEVSATTHYIYGTSTNDATNTFSAKISTSSSAPSSGTYYQRLGSFYNDENGNIRVIKNDGFFADMGDAVSKTAATTYQALTDGIIMAQNETNSTHTEIYIHNQSSGITDTTPWRNNATAAGSSVGVPVKKGDYYHVSVSATRIEFTPINE